MAFSGKIVAANHADLLAKITAFITGDAGTPGRDWTVLRQDSLTYGPATVFRNSGLSGSEEVNIGFYAATYTNGVKGGLVCKVYKAFDAAADGTAFLDTAYGNGVGQYSTHALLPCWNAAMNVWIWSNKARVIVIAECNGLYANAYLGQYKRFCLPSENPWPLACLTDGYTSLWGYSTWHDVVTTSSSYSGDQDRRSFPFVRRGMFPMSNSSFSWLHACHQICRADGVWTSHFAVCPTETLMTLYGGAEKDMELDTKGHAIVFPEGTARMLLPLYLIQMDATASFEGASLVGELYGVRWVPDSLAGTESTVEGYTLFPDINRVEWYSFMAIGDE